MLVFDCVALRLREGISGLFFRSQGYVFFLRAEDSLGGVPKVFLLLFTKKKIARLLVAISLVFLKDPLN